MCLAVFRAPRVSVVLMPPSLRAAPRLLALPKIIDPKSDVHWNLLLLYCVRPEEILVKPGWHHVETVEMGMLTRPRLGGRSERRVDV